MTAFAFRPAPTYRAASPDEQMTAAFDMPMSLLSTLGQQAKGGVLDSFGLGTAIRNLSTPEGPRSTMDNVGSALSMANPITGLYEGVRGVVNSVRRDSKLLSDEEYQSSPYYREGVKWDAGMTEDRAAALAESFDAKRVRDHFASKRPITAFIGNIAGQAIDPINYIPVMGPAVKAANVARFGRIGGAAITNALDAAANTAIAGGLTYGMRRDMGDDITWQSTVSEIAMSALIGGAFGTVSGVLDGRRAARVADATSKANEAVATLRNVQDARVALNSAIDGLVRGEDVNLSANAADAVQRLADQRNPVWSPDTFASLDRQDLFSSTAVGRVIDTRPVMVQDAEAMLRRQVFEANPELATRFSDAEAKFAKAQDAVAAIEEPLQARRQSDTLSLIDPQSAERLRVIENELSGNVPAKQRAKLEAERDLIVGSFGPDALAKAENDFRIGPEKQAKAARKALATARQEFSKVRKEADSAAERIRAQDAVKYRASVDLSPARPDPPPAGRVEAEARIAAPETYKAASEQYGVNADDGSFVEQADVEQMRNEGRLTPDDEAAIAEADATYENGLSYGEALKAVVGCLIA